MYIPINAPPLNVEVIGLLHCRIIGTGHLKKSDEIRAERKTLDSVNLPSLGSFEMRSLVKICPLLRSKIASA